MTTSPIAIFVYKRPEHTKQMLISLCQNPGYESAEITVYCDGPRSNADDQDISATRGMVRKLLPQANIVERDENLGLANSIITGVSEKCQKYGRVIVIE
ncbi:MAG: glycosyltransferase family 2 protein, partial [Gammaproteobacteria bacterium]|nr:glycosyltransferase family 2 protein [Gammaproteobacteria bacterium]